MKRDLYAPPPLERYTVGANRLVRCGGLQMIPTGIRARSLEASIHPRDYPKPKHKRQRLVVACGMGTDSLAMLIGMHRRGIRPDVISWADTGSERLHTYLYVRVLQEWLKRVGFPPLVIVRRRCPTAGHRSYYEECWNNEQLPSPAFHIGGRAKHDCSKKWKVDPQRAFQTALGWLWDHDHAQAVQAIGFDASEVGTRKGASGQVVEAIGFDLGESDPKTGRASLRYGVDNCVDYRQWYPLADWGMTRQACMDLIADEGLPQPGKSACFMCPVSKLCEITEMDPDERDATRGLEQRWQSGRNYTGKVEGLAVGKTWDEWEQTGRIKPGLGLRADAHDLEPEWREWTPEVDPQARLF
jgi:hypothetical protein